VWDWWSTREIFLAREWQSDRDDEVILVSKKCMAKSQSQVIFCRQMYICLLTQVVLDSVDWQTMVRGSSWLVNGMWSVRVVDDMLRMNPCVTTSMVYAMMVRR
jgi:hypothetical protein